MDCDGIAKSLVRVPHEAEDLAGIFQGHLNNVVQDKLLLIWPALRLGPGEVDHDVLPPCVFRTIEKGHRGVREIPIMTLEQQLLGPVPDLQSRAQDKITWLPDFHKAFPPEATRKHISYFLTLDLIRLQADSLFQGLEKGVFGSVVNLYLFIVVGRLLYNRAESVVGHFSGDRVRLSLVATADDLDASTLEPVEESLQGGAGHCADLVPDDHTGNELLPHPFRSPLRLATPSEEAVVGLAWTPLARTSL